MMKRGMVIGSVLALVNLPLALALIEGVSYHVRNRSNGSIISSGVEREYLLHVPRSYDRSKPTPLVISMHGGSLWPAAQKKSVNGTVSRTSTGSSSSTRPV